MKYIKLFESFEDINDNDVIDIFSPVCDLGFDILDVYEGNFLTPSKDIVDYHEDMSKPSIRGIAIRIDKTGGGLGMNIDDTFVNELNDSILHFESQFKCELHYISLRTPAGIWFRNIDVVRNNMDLIINHSSKFTSYIDVVFRTK